MCNGYKPSSALQALLEVPLFTLYLQKCFLQIPIVFFLLNIYPNFQTLILGAQISLPFSQV